MGPLHRTPKPTCCEMCRCLAPPDCRQLDAVQCPDSDRSQTFAAHSQRTTGIKGTLATFMARVPLSNPKFAIGLAARVCELRVRGTRCAASPQRQVGTKKRPLVE